MKPKQAISTLCVVAAIQTVPASSIESPNPSHVWNAQWIGLSAVPESPGDRNLWTCFRKEFALARKPKSAVARIAVDSKYWLWVNGKLVVFEGGLKRGPNPEDTYYDLVDLAP